jgi:hypothetical protein
MLSKTDNAHCMSCKVEWDRKFLTDNLDSLFMTKHFKEHRENVCFERELGMLQGTQVYVEKQIRVETLKNELKEVKTLISELEKKRYEIERQLVIEKNVEIEVSDHKKFVRRCPNGECLGFLSSSLKCELCGIFACSECREIKGKTSEERESHKCDTEVVESIKMIDSDSKACPKCSSLIFKTEGCFEKDTPILMWDQSVKMSQDIVIGDILIGDDGEPRNVLDTCSGEDNMYEITQNNGENYVVNSKHTLVLKTEGMECKEIEILVEDYMKLTENKKKLLYGFKSSNGINYSEQAVDLDPYLLGLGLNVSNDTIPQEYMMNSRKIRLEVLTGFINSGKTQVNKKLANQIFILSHSLGLQDHKTSISVKLIGRGIYYGWKVDGNHRFVGNDFTVLRNCNQMYCVCCHTAFDWKTLKIEKGEIHNPEYFEYLRRKGTLERNPNEVLCGRELNDHLYTRIMDRLEILVSYDVQEIIKNIIIKGIHIRLSEQPRFRRDRLNDNLDLRIMYMRKQIDKEKFKALLQKREKDYSKSNEIHNVLAMFVNCLTEILYRINDNSKNSDADQIRHCILECNELRLYTNECLTRISKTYKSKEYQITKLFNFN